MHSSRNALGRAILDHEGAVERVLGWGRLKLSAQSAPSCSASLRWETRVRNATESLEQFAFPLFRKSLLLLTSGPPRRDRQVFQVPGS